MVVLLVWWGRSHFEAGGRSASVPDAFLVEMVVEGFEGTATLPLQLAAGNSPSFQRSNRDPAVGASCLALSYRDAPPGWGTLQMPFWLCGAETHLRLWIRCRTATATAALHLYLGEEDGDGWLSPALPLRRGEKWRQIDLAITDFEFSPDGNKMQDILSVERLVVVCRGGDLAVDLDELRVAGPDVATRRARELEARQTEPADIRIDDTRPVADWGATLAAQYDPIQFMPESTSPNRGRRGMNESWWTVERERVRKMGLQAVRVWFQVDWWEPFNDDDDPRHRAADFRGFATDSPRMQSVYRFLDFCQEAGIEVQLDFGWKMDLPARAWLATDSTLQRESPEIRDADEYVESLITLLQYLHDVKKYSVVTHVSLGNEFEYDYAGIYPALHARLLDEGMRDRYVLVGLESNRGIEPGAGLVSRHPGVLDVHSLHSNQARAFRGLVRRDLEVLASRQVPAGRFGSRGRVAYTEFALGPASGVEIADAVLTFAAEGAYGCGGWRLADQHLVSPIEKTPSGDRFDHGLHKWGTWNWVPWMQRPRESYYAVSLLTRYTQRGSRIFGADGTGERRRLRAVCFEKHGDFTVLVVNRDSRQRRVHLSFAKTADRRLRRHLFSADRLPGGIYDTLVPSDRDVSTASFEDELPAQSFALYTTLPDCPQIEVDPPLAVANPGDTLRFTARQIACRGTVAWRVDGGAANGTISRHGIYVAPRGLPAIDPVVVRATEPASGAVGLAVVSFSGAPTVLTDRPTVITGRGSAERGGSRVFDLGRDVELDRVLELGFSMVDLGAGPAEFRIDTSVPWLHVSPSTGSVPPGGKEEVRVELRLDTHHLAPETWYRGHVRVLSPRGLGLDVLDVFFRTASRSPGA